jgi:maltooligosyltrehalose synthase
VDLLRNLFGNLTSGIIRLAVTGGILFLCYLFIVKPVLKTTNDAIHSTGLDQISKTFNTVDSQVQRQIRQSFRTTKARGGNPRRLIHCIQRANQDVQRIQRCTARY